MSSIAIFDTTNSTSSLYNTTQATSVDTTQQTTATTSDTKTSEEDTVKLSAAAQAKAMHQSGQSIASIASALGTDTKTVDSYLGITVTEAIEQTLKAAEATITATA